jgi:hypothetical protein
MRSLRRAAISGRTKGDITLSTSPQKRAAVKRLPPGFGKIDPNAPWDSKRFFTALAATGNTPSVFYEIDADKMQLRVDVPYDGTTKLQEKRLRNLYAWQNNMDPKRRQQFEYVSTLVRSLPFAPRTEGESPRYFYYPLA